MKLTIAVDVDEVCADLLGEWLRRINRDFQYVNDYVVEREHVTEWDMSGHVPEGENAYSYLQDADLYDCVQPIPGALQAVEALRAAGHRVIFVTSCTQKQYDAKERWLVRHGFLPEAYTHKDLVLTSDKSLIRADVLIDDGPHNLEAFTGATAGLGICIDKPHNREAWNGWRAINLVDAVRLIGRIEHDRQVNVPAAPALVQYGSVVTRSLTPT